MARRSSIVIWLVRSGGTIAVCPPRPTVASLTPCGLVILIDSGAAARPGSGWNTIRLIVRMPRQLKVSEALRLPAIHAPGL
jgi:hypothetical protein